MKSFNRKGAAYYVRIGENEILYNQDFRFYLFTNIQNPNFLPEITIHVTMINFSITKKGLEDQLLVDVVNIERKDLED